jgi:ATP-dependent Clp protease adaptor protein ClpS
LALAEVKLLNDDATPMEFVVAVLERVFAMDRVVATRCMFEAHTHGSAACGTYPPDVAAARAAQVLDLARAHGHELRCVVT